MEFLVVSDSKLKIMLTREDMIKYEIDGDDIDYDNPKIRRSFWKILDVAKEACGFQVSGDKILIQFYPSKDGSEVFVTKLGILSDGAEKAISKSSNVAMLTTKRAIYQFSSFSSLVSAAKIIEKEDFERRPRAYFDETGLYYIIADERRGSSGKFSEITPIAEFGKELPSIISGYVAEHSSEIDFDVLYKL